MKSINYKNYTTESLLTYIMQHYIFKKTDIWTDNNLYMGMYYNEHCK